MANPIPTKRGHNFIDLIGQTFGRLTVKIETGRNRQGSVLWLCQCQCRQTITVSAPHLRYGITKSCGCLPPPNFKDLIGKVFHSLTVIGDGGRVKTKTGKGQARWRCRCECGKIVVVVGQRLRDGSTKSCGCFRVKVTGKRATTHGMSKTSEHRIWAGIKNRCLNPAEERFKDYGGRGIVICQRWRESFAAFFSDLGVRPSSRHSIDRIDNNGHYSCGECSECLTHQWPANCRWATMETQQRNKLNNRVLTFNGTAQTLADWSETCGINRHTLTHRLQLGWSVEKALTTPVRKW